MSTQASHPASGFHLTLVCSFSNESGARTKRPSHSTGRGSRWTLAHNLLTSDFERTALYDELAAKCGTQPDAGWERIAPVLPTPDERATLRMRRGEAAFFLERLGTAHGVPIEWRTTLIRWDRYRFVSHFAADTAPALVATQDR